MTYIESILRVLLVGLLLGAGLPALFASGLVAYSRGAGGVDTDGSVHQPRPALRILGVALFAVVAAIVLVAILYITRGTIQHHFGFDPVPFIPGG